MTDRNPPRWIFRELDVVQARFGEQSHNLSLGETLFESGTKPVEGVIAHYVERPAPILEKR